MRLIVPYAANSERDCPGLRQETVAALVEHSPIQPVFHDVSSSEAAYFSLLKSEWELCNLLGQDLMVVEHDVVIHDTVVEGFLDCPEPWCAYPYRMGENVIPALGCTRFRHELIWWTQDMWPKVALFGQAGNYDDGVGVIPPKHWGRLDVRIDAVLMPLGLRPHVHQPPVGHLNPNHETSDDFWEKMPASA